MPAPKPVLLKLVWMVVFLLSFAACAGLQPPVKAPEGPARRQSLSMTASSFEFRPNNIVATAGDTLDLHVTNTSSITHNLTVKAPDGTELSSVDLSGGSTVEVEVPLRTPGVYDFYCDKPLHATFGMKGHIEVR